MLFKDKYPNAKARECITPDLFVDTEEKCFMCGTPTRFIDIRCQIRVCSDECMHQFHEEYLKDANNDMNEDCLQQIEANIPLEESENEDNYTFGCLKVW